VKENKIYNGENMDKETTKGIHFLKAISRKMPFNLSMLFRKETSDRQSSKMLNIYYYLFIFVLLKWPTLFEISD
jgi:hypothetical protein